MFRIVWTERTDEDVGIEEDHASAYLAPIAREVGGRHRLVERRETWCQAPGRRGYGQTESPAARRLCGGLESLADRVLQEPGQADPESRGLRLGLSIKL